MAHGTLRKTSRNLQKTFFPIIKLKYLLTDDNSPETETIYKNNIKLKKYNLNWICQQIKALKAHKFEINLKKGFCN